MAITEDYVSFETAKLLKEKGFDGQCSKVWIYSKSLDSENNAQLVSSIYFIEGKPIIDNADIYKILTIEDRYEEAYLCPTLQMAMKWLREHSLFIDIYYDCDFGEGYKFSIHKLPKGTTLESHNENYSTYEEACEEAIKYYLENLI